MISKSSPKTFHIAGLRLAMALMQPVVAKLTEDDMIALAAFMASRNP